MILEPNETHDVSLTSWVESANAKGCDFPIQNLPLAVFRNKDSEENFRGGVAIGDQVLDLAKVSARNLFCERVNRVLEACAEPTLNRFMAMGQESWSALRLNLSQALRTGSDKQFFLEDCLIAQDQVEFTLPCKIGDYTDFYTSIYHAKHVGRLFRPDNPLMPNYKWLPVGYHGRASSIQVSGQDVRRPWGQIKTPTDEIPRFSPSERLDFELELGIFIGKGNEPGEPIKIDQAEQHVFGFCLLNDWSARDIQAWEYVPLGPFLGKSFASTISPWIVSNEALIPYRVACKREESEQAVMSYLDSPANRQLGAIDIKLQVELQSRRMREQNQPAVKLGETSFAHSYWTVAQMIAHHSVNGCNLQAGNLFGSGTQSGPSDDEMGSMLEMSEGGKNEISLPGGETRTFLEDGDCVILTAYCDKTDAAGIGFGRATGTVLAANTS